MSPARYAVDGDIGRLAAILLDSIDATVAFWDRNQVCVFANEAYRDWFGVGREELVGTQLSDFHGPALYTQLLPHIAAAYAGSKQVFERPIRTPNGSIRHSLVTYTPFFVDGDIEGILVHLADVTPLKKLEAELRNAQARSEHLAMHDALSGLPNRLALLNALTCAIDAANDEHTSVALLSFDVDDFKKVNDTHGHAAGDAFLVEIADRLRTCVRKSDTIGRMGGDEFLLIAREVDMVEAEHTATRVLRVVGEPLLIGGEMLSPTVSVGVALYPAHGDNVDSLIAASDRAMYVAKNLGKNRYVLC